MSESGMPVPPVSEALQAPRPQGRASSTCSSCGSTENKSTAQDVAAGPYVYALGRVEARYPNLSVEKEFAQAAGRAETVGLTEPEVLAKLLSAKENRYLARRVCWILTIEGIETYVLHPRDSDDLDMLIGALRPMPRVSDLNVLIGRVGQLAPPLLCNGLTLPTVQFDQIFSFDVDSFVNAIPVPEGNKEKEKEFRVSVLSLFNYVLQMTDNQGLKAQDRAVNYLATRYPNIYYAATDQHARDASLDRIEVRPSRLAQHRTIVDVVFSYRNRKTDVVTRFFTRVDVSEEFPFLVSKLAPFYEN